MRKQQAGFTLIEIAIVLVIIGLLLGGVLKGQELITQAKIKNAINDFNGVSAAYYGYQDRYKTMPGDDANAPGRWNTSLTNKIPASAGAAPLNYGDGIISGNYSDTAAAAATTETELFWQELRLAGFINGDPNGAAPPQNTVGGIVGVQWVPGGTSVLGYSAPGLLLCSTKLPGKIAESIDAQLDDGKPNSGAIHAFKDTGNPTTLDSTTVLETQYVDDTTTRYVICKMF